MWNDSTQYDYLVPVIWQTDANTSPHVNQRASLYGVGGIPHAQWNGTKEIIGGGSGVYSAYVSQYNQLIDFESPAEINTQFDSNAPGELTIESEVNLTDDINTNNNKILFLITYDYGSQQTPDYFCSVIYYAEEAFELTSVGQSQIYSHTFIVDNSFDVTQMKAVVIIQSLDSPPLIHQSSITDFTGLYPNFTCDVVQGPPDLQVNFSNNSLPDSIQTWEWDLNGDGEIDSYQENPSFIYQNIGSYDVGLTISTDDDSASTYLENYITVTEPSTTSGSLAGYWKEEYSPYQVNGDILIPSGSELVIEPGVDIIFFEGTKFEVKGKLIANGISKDEDPIVFNSNEEWEGIIFNYTNQNNLIKNCIIENATISAIRIENSSNVQIIQNQISNNNSTSRAAGIDMLASDSILIQKNIISNNSNTSLTAGIGCNATTAMISNNIIVNNSGMIGAFSLKNGSDVDIINNTIVNNESTYNTPYMFLIFDSEPQIRNSILLSEGELFYNSGGYPNVNYSCLSQNYVGMGNINADPQFVDPSTGIGYEYDGLSANWDLQTSSPCINAGDPDSIYFDLDGTRNDMGAYGGPNPYQVIEQSINNNPAVNELVIFPNPMNPFTPSQTIRLYLNKPSQLKIELFNIKGRKIRTIINEKKEAGEHNIIWNIDNGNKYLGVGVYLYRIKANLNIIFQKTVIMN